MSTAPPTTAPRVKETRPVTGPRSDDVSAPAADGLERRAAEPVDAKESTEPTARELDRSAVDRPLVDVSLLEDKTPAWFKSTPRLPLAVLVLGLVYLASSYQPLDHLDLWGHLAYGRWIAAEGTLPATEPLLPLAKGMPFLDSAWLWQVAGFGTVEAFGYAGLKFLQGLGVALAAGILLGWIAHRTGSFGWGAFSAVVLLAIEWEHLALRPQLAGLVLFAALLGTLHARPRRWHLVAVPVGFALWANLHGSWIVGVGLLAAWTAGRAVDHFTRTGRWSRLPRDRRLVHSFVLLELAAAATLLNPYGLALHVDVLSFSSNPNLAALVEWQPLSVAYLQGQVAFTLAAALFLVHRVSPRRATTAELVLLVGLGGAAVWTSRMIVWWGVVAAWSLSLHSAAAWRRLRGNPLQASGPEPRGLWTVVALGLGWIVFAISPLGVELLHADDDLARKPGEDGPARYAGSLPVERQVDAGTPVAIARTLRADPPQGLVFNTYEWGDWLLWAGPPGIELFVNSHAHLVPPEVWQSYLHVAAAGEGWEEILARHGVNTVAVDKAVRGRLIEALERSEDWERIHDDRLGAVFQRRRPI